MFSQFLHPLTRIGRRTRIAATAVCLLLAGVSALEPAPDHALASPGRTAAVVVARRALPAGHLVGRTDVATLRWPRAVRPASTFADPKTVVGRRLAAPVGRHEAVTAPRLLGQDLTTGLDADTVAVPVNVDTDLAGLIRAGDRVDLLAVPRPELLDPGDSAEHRAHRVAGPARVLAVLRGADPAGASRQTQVVLAVNRSVALRIAGLRPSEMFTLVGDSP